MRCALRVHPVSRLRSSSAPRPSPRGPCPQRNTGSTWIFQRSPSANMPAEVNGVKDDSPCLPFDHHLEKLSEEQYAELLRSVNTTQDSLKKDTALLREWLAQQPHLPTLSEKYDPWLARYIIAKKNSLERTKESLDLYFTAKGLHLDLFYPGPPETWKSIFQLVSSSGLPRISPHGTRIILSRIEPAAARDPSSINWKLYFALTAVMTDYLIGADRHPVAGELVIDLANYNAGLNNGFLANMFDFKRLIEASQGGVPLQLKSVHLLNAPGLIRAVIAMVKPFLKDKLSERIHVHDKLEACYEYIPRECMPKDYGGQTDKTLRDLSGDWITFLSMNYPWHESRRSLTSDEKKRIGGSTILENSYGLEGSFRKLAVD